MLGGSFVNWAGTSSGCGWRRWPPDMKGSCNYIEEAVMDSRQEVVLKLGGLAWAKNFSL
jgi:hypothetical protein